MADVEIKFATNASETAREIQATAKATRDAANASKEAARAEMARSRELAASARVAKLSGKATADEIRALNLATAASRQRVAALRAESVERDRLARQAEIDARRIVASEKQIAMAKRPGMGRGQAIQNTSFQVQDVAVQLMGGQSAALALSQNLPQLLGSFGPIGALSGAAVAIAGLSYALITMGGGVEKSLEDLGKALKEAQGNAAQRGLSVAGKMDQPLRQLVASGGNTKDLALKFGHLPGGLESSAATILALKSASNKDQILEQLSVASNVTGIPMSQLLEKSEGISKTRMGSSDGARRIANRALGTKTTAEEFALQRDRVAQSPEVQSLNELNRIELQNTVLAIKDLPAAVNSVRDALNAAAVEILKTKTALEEAEAKKSKLDKESAGFYKDLKETREKYWEPLY